ncbi:MAG TPA: DUF6249 domain-containing protein [Usitatibacteraceae bacterium]
MDFGTSLIAIVATVAGMGVPVAIVAMVLWYKSRNTRLMHETAIRLAEKGQPVPPELFLSREEPYSDLRRGVVLTAVGIALCIALNQLGVAWTIGLIPLFMGLGYMLVWKLESRGPRDGGTHS